MPKANAVSSNPPARPSAGIEQISEPRSITASASQARAQLSELGELGDPCDATQCDSTSMVSAAIPRSLSQCMTVSPCSAASTAVSKSPIAVAHHPPVTAKGALHRARSPRVRMIGQHAWASRLQFAQVVELGRAVSYRRCVYARIMTVVPTVDQV